MGFYRGANVVTDGLVLSLDAANPKSYVSGSTVWTDLSSNNNSGSLVNGPTFDSANGGSIVFDGVNDYVLSTSNIFKENFNINWQPSWSLDSWMFNESGSNPSSWYSVYNGGQPATYASPSINFQADNLVYFEPFLTYRRTFGLSINVGNILYSTTGSWNNFSYTFDGTRAKFYLNGVQRGATALWTSSYIGFPPSATDIFNDEFRIGGVQKIAVDSQDKIYVGGSFTKYNNNNENFLIKLNPNGSKDSSFNTGIGFNNEVYSIEILPSGKINVGGSFQSYSGSVNSRGLIRLNPDGTKDGINLTANTFFVVKDIKTNSTGSSYIAGIASYTLNNQNTWPLTRISESVPDPAFSSNPASFPSVNSDSYYYGIALDANEDVYAVGSATLWKGTTTSNRIVKVDKSGNILSASFNVGTGFNSYARAIKIDSNGKLIVVGDFTTYSGSTANRIARINTDGTLDTSFVSGNGFNNSVRDIYIEPSGKIIAAGNFTSYSGSSWNRLVRINSNGTIDSTFLSSSGFDQMVNTVAVDSTGSLYVGGNFYNYSGSYCNAVVKLTSSGSIDNTFNSGTGFNRRMERTPTDTPSFGADRVIASRYVKGKQSVHRIYNRALSDAEILQNYNATKARFGL